MYLKMMVETEDLLHRQQMQPFYDMYSTNKLAYMLTCIKYVLLLIQSTDQIIGHGLSSLWQTFKRQISMYVLLSNTYV